MKQEIQTSTFIILLITIMIIILIMYSIFIIPKVRPMCTKVNPCAITQNCKCENKECICEYINASGDLEYIQCPIDNY